MGHLGPGGVWWKHEGREACPALLCRLLINPGNYFRNTDKPHRSRCSTISELISQEHFCKALKTAEVLGIVGICQFPQPSACMKSNRSPTRPSASPSLLVSGPLKSANSPAHRLHSKQLQSLSTPRVLHTPYTSSLLSGRSGAGFKSTLPKKLPLSSADSTITTRLILFTLIWQLLISIWTL